MADREPTAAWWEAAHRARRFAERQRPDLLDRLDFSEAAAKAAYARETFGEGERVGLFDVTGPINGYVYGTHCVNLTLAQWREGITQGFLIKAELLADPAFAEDLEWLRAQLDLMPAGSSVLGLCELDRRRRHG